MEKFEILFQIGEGTYGKVTKAFHKQTEKYFAIKEIKNIETIPQIRKIAYREIKILKSLKHPNIVSLEEVITSANTLFLVFEFVDCNMLEHINANSSGISLTETKSLTFQLAKALQHCHSFKIVHRDIKPENLLVSKQGHLKLCDFGFSRSLKLVDQLTEYVSTRWYRAPELLVGGKYSFAVDIWALGCLTYEMFTGQPLFPGSSDYDTLNLIVRACGNLPSILARTFNNNTALNSLIMPKTANPIIDNILSKIPRELAEFIKVCLNMDPDERINIENLINNDFFAEFTQDSSKRNRKNYFSPYKSRPNIHYSSNSPGFIRKISPSKENDSYGKGKEDIGYRKHINKLPNIKYALPESRKKDPVEVLYPTSKSRLGTKSTMKGGYVEKELMKKKYSLLPNNSNESLAKLSFHNQSTSIRNKPVFENGIITSGSSSKYFTKKNVSKLDLSFLSKNMGISGLYYASSRK